VGFREGGGELGQEARAAHEVKTTVAAREDHIVGRPGPERA
jgi:hypothetical protein